LRVDPNYINQLAVAVDQSSNTENKLTTELSSGLRVNSLQDDPVAAARSALLGSAIVKDDSYVRAASGVQAKLQVTDSTLGEVVRQLTTAVTLSVQGGNGTLSASNIASIGQQLSGIRDEVLSLANTSYLGSYLFSGSQGSVKPFVLDTTTVPATTTYAGDSKVQSIETPIGQKIQTNLPGSAIFGTAASGVFAALNQLVADFSSGTPGTSAVTDSAALSAALSQVSSQRSVLDSSLSRVQSTSTYAQTVESELTAQQNTLVAADPVTLATQLKSAETQHQALLSVMSAIDSTNLFTYMK
jgi:flagellar hook-associated protein 3 FlgL